MLASLVLLGIGVLRALLVGVLWASLLVRVGVLRASQVGVTVLRATKLLVDVTVLLNDSCQ
jgi:hypothetical protein